jgi:hypothetical protein
MFVVELFQVNKMIAGTCVWFKPQQRTANLRIRNEQSDAQT